MHDEVYWAVDERSTHESGAELGLYFEKAVIIFKNRVK